jgi:hypothetical protein
MEQIQAKRLLFSRILKSFVIGSCLLVLTCKIDHGLEPIGSRIGGKVFFFGDKNPYLTDEVRVAVIRQFPPRDIRELLFSEIIFSNSDRLPVAPRPWEIYVAPGSYEIVAVIWKANNESWNISDIIGMYGGTFLGDQLVPPYPFKPIILSGSDSVIDTINIEANLNRVNRDATIEGTVTFIGTWPANTGVVGIAAFTSLPKKGDVMDYVLKNAALDYSVPTFVDHANYRLRVRSSDTLKYVAVMWIDNTYDFMAITDIGAYMDPDDPSQPGTVTPKTGQTLGINITVDFSRMGGGS